MMSAHPESISVGRLYTNAEIYGSLKVANAGGLRFRIAHGEVVRAALMTSEPVARKARENPYSDRIEEDVLIYTAAGRSGDQTLAGVNQRLVTQAETGYPIHGFVIVANRDNKEHGPRRWKYLGLLEYVRHYQDTQIDTNRTLRKVWVFELRIHANPRRVPLAMDSKLTRDILKSSKLAARSETDHRVVPATPSTGKEAADPVEVEEVRGRMLNLDPRRFEHALRDVMQAAGFHSIEVTRYSQDGGIDLNAHPPEKTWLLTNLLVQLQAKRWIHTVGRREVAELRGSLRPFAFGALITTSYFSQAALQEASQDGKAPVKLVNGSELSEFIILNKLRHLL